MTKQRTTQALILGDEIRRVLLSYRIVHAIDCDPSATHSRRVTIENRLECSLPDEVLAFLLALGRDLRQVADLTEEAQEDWQMPGYFVAFAEESGPDPQVDESGTYVASAPRYWCFRRGGAPEEVVKVKRWSADEPSNKETLTMVQFLQRFLGTRKLTSEENARLAAEWDDFCPGIQRNDAANNERVRHPKFGEGTLLREFVDGIHKAEVLFDGAGRKVLLASFLERVDSRPSTPPRGSNKKKRAAA